MLVRVFLFLLFLPVIVLATEKRSSASEAGYERETPAGFAVVSSKAGSLSFSWDELEKAEKYVLFLAEKSGVSPQNYSQLPGGRRFVREGSKLTVNGLKFGKIYYAVVTAKIDGFFGEPTKEIRKRVKVASPRKFRGRSYDDSISYKWSRVKDAKKYTLYLAEEKGVTPRNYTSLQGGLKVEVTSSSYVANSLKSGVTYYAVVTATVRGKESKKSLEIQHTPIVIEEGFPVKTVGSTGVYQAGPNSIFVTVADIDDDSALEILFPGVASGPLWSWNHDGSRAIGWPGVDPVYYVEYPSVGNLSGNNDVGEVAAGHGPFLQTCRKERFAYSGDGQVLEGWPKAGCMAGSVTPPMLLDINDDGIDEIFYGLDVYHSNGRKVKAFADLFSTAQKSNTRAIAAGDVDMDGHEDIVVDLHSTFRAYSRDGSLVDGFPFRTMRMRSLGADYVVLGNMVLGDVNNDGRLNIVRLSRLLKFPGHVRIEVYKTTGELLWSKKIRDASSATPVLADINLDEVPEIIVQTEKYLYALDGDGSDMPGWPVEVPKLPNRYTGNSSPVVGDVVGNKTPEIIFTTSSLTHDSLVHVYSAKGETIKGFPLKLPLGGSATPAIADLDLDGRNELIFGGHQGESAWVDSVWVYDLGGSKHGSIEWGQLGGTAKRQYRYD